MRFLGPVALISHLGDRRSASRRARTHAHTLSDTPGLCPGVMGRALVAGLPGPEEKASRTFRDASRFCSSPGS